MLTVRRNKFLLNNKPDAPIIQIYFVVKPYMFRASSLAIIRSFILMQVFDDRFQAESGWSTLTLLGSGHQKPE